MRFKEGDLVKVVKVYNDTPHHYHDMVVEIVKIIPEARFPYSVKKVNGHFLGLCLDDKELVPLGTEEELYY